MLDRMRRHKGWLKWSLGIVVVTFVALYIPSCFFADMGVSQAPTGSIATVNGRKILIGTFQRAYSQQAQSLRSAYGDQFNDQMLQQLGIGPRVLDSAASTTRQCWSRRTGWASACRTRNSASDPDDSRVPAERPVHRLAAVQPVPPAPAPADAPRGIRERGQKADPRRQAPGPGDRLDPGPRHGSPAGIHASQREAEARARDLHGQPVPEHHPADRRRNQAPASRPTRRSTGCRRSAASSISHSTPTRSRAA